jgi:DNA-binding LytR/AlgR family response regulator
MPGLTGIEFTRSMISGPVIIFTTAFEKYALQGFRLDIADYLLKPFTYEEFLTSVNKAERMLKTVKTSGEEILSNNEFLFVKSDYKVKRVNFNDILYIGYFGDIDPPSRLIQRTEV